MSDERFGSLLDLVEILEGGYDFLLVTGCSLMSVTEKIEVSG